MLIVNNDYNQMFNSPIRSFKGRVEVYNGSTLTTVCNCQENLKDFTVERVGEQGKFFGFGICQKLTVNLLDRERQLDITNKNTLEVEFGLNNVFVYPCPNFYVTEVSRNENTNELTITAYDALYKATEHTVEELELPNSYTIRELTRYCAAFLGVPLNITVNEAFERYYEGGANFNGTETIREALNAIAEATQTIYFINYNWELTFIRLSNDSEVVYTIDTNEYFTLSCKPERRLSAIVHATELGDNVEAALEEEDAIQYVRNNPFWELQEDIGEIVEEALGNVGGITNTPFTCSWRGNFLLEIGDRISLVTKDGAYIYSFVTDDTFKFNGALSGSIQWEYTDNKSETPNNPSSIGEVLKLTSAKVDKINQEISMLAQKADANGNDIAALLLNTNSITGTVSTLETRVNANTQEVEELYKAVEATISAEQVEVIVNSRLENGTDKVKTTTGFTFNEEGLTISKSESDIETTITEDGMSVKKGGQEVLTANNQGVKAIDLHATTYLIIGNNSRFEDYNGNRTGCFWIGG